MAIKSKGKTLATFLLGAALVAGSLGLTRPAKAADVGIPVSIPITMETYSIQNYSIKDNETLSYIADSAGNQNGIAGELEQDYMEMKLEKSNDLYIVTQGPSKFEPWFSGSKLYTSEQEIRDAYKGIGIRGEVGILKFNRKGEITGAWWTMGYLSDNKWKEAKVPALDIQKIMDQRWDEFNDLVKYKFSKTASSVK